MPDEGMRTLEYKFSDIYPELVLQKINGRRLTIERRTYVSRGINSRASLPFSFVAVRRTFPIDQSDIFAKII